MSQLKPATLSNADLYALGNDYLQETSAYFVEEVSGKKTYRDGIYTKLKDDVRDPDGLNKRIINVAQSAWAPSYPALSGETDASAVFSKDYATAKVFGYPFSGKDSDPYAK